MSRSISLSTWIVDISHWDPSHTEWESTLALLHPEVQDKIRSYHYQIDAKRDLISQVQLLSFDQKEHFWEIKGKGLLMLLKPLFISPFCPGSLVGKLLAQSFVCSAYSIPWKKISFTTNSFGKPFLANQLPEGKAFNFNITHDGEIVGCIFSEETWDQEEDGKGESEWDIKIEETMGKTHEVGLDIMQIKLPTGQEHLEEFLEFMQDNLSDAEKIMIDQIKTCENSKSSLLAYLLQIWTLKESIIKALGYGLSLELESICLNNLLSESTLEIKPSPLLSIQVDDQQKKGRYTELIIPARSDLTISINKNQDLEWKFWNFIWNSSSPNQSRYILSAAFNFCSPKLIEINQLALRVEFKYFSDLILPHSN